MSEAEARSADDATPAGSDDLSPRTAQDGAPVEPPEAPSVTAPGDTPDDPQASGESPDGEHAGPEPSWWHRSHPTFAGLVGFFSGVAFVIVVPGVYGALLSLLLGDTTAQRLFPLVLIAVLVQLALLIPRKTRRFAEFMLLGVVLTIVVVGVTAAVVIWVLVKPQG